MENIGKALLRTLAALCVVVLLTVITANAQQHTFALWYEASLDGEEYNEVNENATLTVIGMERVPVKENGGECVDIVVNIHGDAGLPWYSFGYNYRLQYEQNGKWYVVGHPGAVPAVGVSWIPAGDTVMRYRVPLLVLQHPGTFRLYVYPLGYCAVPSLHGT